ncbi:hypothetical protein JB92DRAFT_3000716, partial [Gautieria morchelliformis]
DPDGIGWVVLCGCPSLSTPSVRTLVLLLLAEICGAPLAKGRNRTNTSVPVPPPTNTAIRGPCRGPNPRAALSVQSPVPSQTVFHQIWSRPRLSCAVSLRGGTAQSALGSNETRRQIRIAGDPIPGVELQHCGVCGRGGGGEAMSRITYFRRYVT